MPDFATSTNPAVQAQLDRLWALSPGADILGLDRITQLLERLGNPHELLPPVLHVAGTNGKGSTCAFLRTAIEAAGLTCHVYTSPHLVRFNERIRIAGKLIEDDQLASLLEEVLDHAEGIGASFFEVTTAAAFLAFSRTPAAACVIEVGLGGRLDATNVIQRPIVTGIAQLGIDHQAFLGDTIEDIAAEKAGIAKPGVPLVTMRYPEPVAHRIALAARAAGAQLSPAGEHWFFSVESDHLAYRDSAGLVETSLPAMVGPHQPENLALAIAMLRHQTALVIPPEAMTDAATQTRWPARMQQLARGPLTRHLPETASVWLDGGHNAAAGVAIAEAIDQLSRTNPGNRGPIHVVLGMLANKDPAGLLGPIAPLAASLIGVPVPAHEHHDPIALAHVAYELGVATVGTAPDIAAALDEIAHRIDQDDTPALVLILGSLYLSGTVLEANGELPE
jgi:dihydrofolate synthase / folylpolyglutamate synthase